MQAGLFAKKIGMTQIFDESGTIFPVTILKIGLCKVSQIKTVTSDGYNAVQVAYEKQNLKKLNQPTLGQLKKSSFEGTDQELSHNYGYSSFGEFQVLDPKNLHNKVLKSDLTNIPEIVFLKYCSFCPERSPLKQERYPQN